MKEMNNVMAVRTYFKANGGTEVTMAEMKELSPDERAELGAMCAEALGVKIKSKKKAAA